MKNTLTKCCNAFLNQSSLTFHCVGIMSFHFIVFANEHYDLVNGLFQERTKEIDFANLH